MKISRSSFSWGRVASVICVGFLLISFSTKSLAAPEDNSAEAAAAARAWLAQLDAGKYSEGYAAGCIAFHEKVSRDNWLLVLKTIREPRGNVISRKEASHVYKPDGFEGLDGQCIIITYDTSFQNLPSAIEQVVVKKENGRWLGAGYFAGPKPSTDAASDSAPASPTEVQTLPHAQAH